MSARVRPQLRPHLAAAEDGQGGYVVWDQLRLAERRLHLSGRELSWMQLLDGRRSVPELHAAISAGSNGNGSIFDVFNKLLHELDEALFLDNPRFRARLRSQAENPIRPPACTPSYGNDPHALRRSLDSLFTGPSGPGRPGPRQPDRRFRAALVPHIDYGRGGRTYAWVFKEIYERTPASLFVIIGTSHYSSHRFTLTRKHFQTPLGIAQTDQTYIDRLVTHYGDGLFDDELPAHMPEHSIELEVVFLQYLFGNAPFRIVPLVVGSYHDCIAVGREPIETDDIGRMITALRAVERQTEDPICYLISGDLAHLGPKFGDPHPVTPSMLAHSRRLDESILHQLGEYGIMSRRAAPPDAAAFFRGIAEEKDARRICGLPPTYTVLEALHPTRGEVVHYDRYVHPDGFESVSFSGVLFYKG
jgi:AmmeMemoRadiSam system protein B